MTAIESAPVSAPVSNDAESPNYLVDPSACFALGSDRKSIVAALKASGYSNALATKIYDRAHRVRMEAESASLARRLADKSVAVLKTTRRKDGTLGVVIADEVTMAQARAKVEAHYAKLASKRLAKLGL